MASRYDECREVNKNKIHRLWREEGLQVKDTSPSPMCLIVPLWPYIGPQDSQTSRSQSRGTRQTD